MRYNFLAMSEGNTFAVAYGRPSESGPMHLNILRLAAKPSATIANT